MNQPYKTELLRLAKILDFGASCLAHQKNYLRRMTIRKSTLLGMVVAAHNYTESIYSLCKEGQSQACFVLLRSLIENRINAKFLFASSNSEHAYALLKDALINKEKQLNHAIEYFKKNSPEIPNTFSIEDLQESLKQIMTQIGKIKQESVIGIVNRAIEVDKYNKDKGLKSASLEWEYILIYRNLCTLSHLDLLGLPDFFNLDSKGIIEAFLSGNSDEIEVILQMAHDLYVDILKMFRLKFKSSLKS